MMLPHALLAGTALAGSLPPLVRLGSTHPHIAAISSSPLPTAARQACGCTDLTAWNVALHDPNRPTFGQLSPLLHAFMAAGDGGSSCSSTSGSSSSTGASSTGLAPVVVAHNGVFDARMLIGEWTRRGLPVPQHWRWVVGCVGRWAGMGFTWAAGSADGWTGAT